MYFPLTYFSAIFLIFASLASASPAPADGSYAVTDLFSGLGPSTGPSDPPQKYSILQVPATILLYKGNPEKYIDQDSKSRGVFIVENIPTSFNPFANKKQYYGIFLGPLDTGGEKIKKIPYKPYGMTGLHCTLVGSGLFDMKNNPPAIMVEKVRVYDHGLFKPIGVLSDREYKRLDARREESMSAHLKNVGTQRFPRLV